MRFFLDQGMPRSTVDELLDRGFEAEHVGQLGMARALDEEILEAASNRDAVVVTLDADFHTLLATANATTPSVIRMRIEGLKGKDVAASGGTLGRLDLRQYTSDGSRMKRKASIFYGGTEDVSRATIEITCYCDDAFTDFLYRQNTTNVHRFL